LFSFTYRRKTHFSTIAFTENSVLADRVFLTDYLQLLTRNSLSRSFGSVASLNYKNLYFSYKYFNIFVAWIVQVFSQSDVGCNAKTNTEDK
jgi:ABC-type long-subunit fatty acid transport system fused permease/ATPase subunit